MIYKFINIPNHQLISDKVYTYVSTRTDILGGKAIWNWADKEQVLNTVPELKEAIDLLGLEIERISIIKAEPRANIRIHIDYDKEPRMLWPIRNCLGSFTKFFKVDPANIVEQRGVKNDIYYLITKPELAEQIDALELVAPVMFKPWIAHSVWTNPDCSEHRLTMTIKFKNSTEHVFPKD
jgi:hypothetical protein